MANKIQTQKTISKERDAYCTDLSNAAADVLQWENRKDRLKELVQQKKCWFAWTDKNYRTYRHLELEVGTELVQTNDSIKDNVSSYTKLNKSLSDDLKKIVTSVTIIKTKVTDLRDAACKLKNCMEESCNCIPMTILTGEPPPNCRDKPKDDDNRPHEHSIKECKDVKVNLDNLVCMPKALFMDIDSILKSAINVVGIQIFSNIDSLDPLQKELSDTTKTFDNKIQSIIKARETELKKAFDELITSGKELAKAKVDLYAKRSDFEGIIEAVDYLCDPRCVCIEEEKGDCEKRLYECECDICKICDDVKNIFAGNAK